MEVCAEGGVLVQQLARRVAGHGGAALIADYGHDGTKTDTLRVRRLFRTFIDASVTSEAAEILRRINLV